MFDEFQEVRRTRAHVILGKNGVSPTVLKHVRNRLKKQRILKIKVLPEANTEYGIDYFIETIARELKVYVLDVRGFTFIISKRKIPGVHMPKKFLGFRNPSLKDEISTEESGEESTEESGEESTEESGEESTEESGEKSTEESGEESAKKAMELPSETSSEQPVASRAYSNSDYIDYDDEELLAEIDKESDEIYGLVEPETPESLEKKSDSETSESSNSSAKAKKKK
ncbi:MAG: YhbY family RNA-binding protein, partial [Promethearchaeota archaeon]